MQSKLARSRSDLLLLLERLLLACGLAAAVILAATFLRAGVAAQEARAKVNPPLYSVDQAATTDGKIIPDKAISGTYLTNADAFDKSHVMGLVRVPALSLSAPIISGIEDRDLARGVGRIPGSATAGGLGNMALAGHRDTFFRPLRRVTAGMFVFVSGSRGDYRYQVDTTEIVTPDQLQILDIGTRPELTLITCYPFDFIGAAPKRFVVHAHLTSVEPELRQP